MNKFSKAVASYFLGPLLLLIFSANAYSQAYAPENRLYFAHMLDDEGLRTGYLPIINVGKDTLAITSIKTNCGCTKAKTDRDIINPGDTAMVEISFNPVTFLGEVKKKVTLTFGPKNQKIELYMEGEVAMSQSTIDHKFPVAIELVSDRSSSHDPSSGSGPLSNSRTSGYSEDSHYADSREEKGRNANNYEEGSVQEVFRLSTLQTSIKAMPNHMLPILTYNQSNHPVAIIITEKPKYIKAEPLLSSIPPGSPCTILIETKGNIPYKSSSGKINCKIVDAHKHNTLGTFSIELSIEGE